MKNNDLETLRFSVFLTDFNVNLDDNVECQAFQQHSTNRLSMPLSCFELRHFEPYSPSNKTLFFKNRFVCCHYLSCNRNREDCSPKKSSLKTWLFGCLSFGSLILKKCKEVNTS